jgi:flagellar biosynthesis anti-sigma factor FlgM
MSIKIDGNRPTGDADATHRVGTSRTQERVAQERTAVQGDRVEVSKDAQLMTSALKAAQESSAIRHDVVERMRKLLESGELGKDSGKLADALIDHMLNK